MLILKLLEPSSSCTSTQPQLYLAYYRIGKCYLTSQLKGLQCETRVLKL